MNGCAFLAAGSPRSPVLAHLNVNAITFNTQQAKDAELDRMATSALKLRGEDRISEDRLGPFFAGNHQPTMWLPPGRATDATRKHLRGQWQ